MSSRKRPNNKTSNYLITMVSNDFDRNSKNILGKLRSNFMGTEFQLYNSGRSPKDIQLHESTQKNEDNIKLRSELAVILYAKNVIGSKGPRRMRVCLGNMEEEKEPNDLWQPAHKDDEMLTCFKHKIQPAINDLYILQNKIPQWNDQIGAFVLNFNGRVTKASVKNFQLTHEMNEEKIILQVS